MIESHSMIERLKIERDRYRTRLMKLEELQKGPKPETELSPSRKKKRPHSPIEDIEESKDHSFEMMNP